MLSALPTSAYARDFTLDDLLSIKEVSSPRLSPDGESIAYVETRNDLDKDEQRSSIFVVSRDGANARRMTAESYSASDPQWSPDGKFLSFIAARDDLDENAASQVYTLDLDGGDAVRYSNAPQGVEAHLWSPKGDKMLLVIRDETPVAKEARLAREAGEDEKARPYVIDRLQFKEDGVGYLDRARAHLYLLAGRDGELRQITFGDYEDAEPAWRPDGAEIAFVSNRTKEPDGNFNTDIWIVSSDPARRKEKPRKLTFNEGPERAPSWSPDGRRIAYVSSVEPKLLWYATNHLAVIDAAGGEGRLVTKALDRNIDLPRFTPTGESVIATIEDNAEQKIAEISLATGEVRPLIAEANTVFEFDLHPSGAIAAPVSRPDLPGEIFLYTDDKLTQATSVNAAALRGVKFSTPLNVTFKAADGAAIHGFIYPPTSGKKKAPGFLFIHGGPTGQYDHSFARTAQIFAANGYAVIMPNPRGSTGWGQEFAAKLFADWGGVDFGDVMAATDDAAARGLVDEKRLVVGGWSYGGILTDHVITKTNRFKAAISGASEVIYIGNYGHDIYQREWETELGLPWENRNAWEKITPFYDVAKVTTPTLVIGGKEDWNVPIVNSEQLYQALKRLGVPTELVVYPGEDHSIDRPSFVKDRLERYLNWYGRYVR
ncbi:MAG: peptidase S9 [Alphaproteobacteria bacterium RIFCSPHIGHO2_12_FULL_63_12]|nr:MAG: peptidase S9 [Alphaproteobacteria bacterium RIFCSPHIGHO2_12_FULL_63_12]